MHVQGLRNLFFSSYPPAFGLTLLWMIFKFLEFSYDELVSSETLSSDKGAYECKTVYDFFREFHLCVPELRIFLKPNPEN